jgi:glycine/D-amino acid oxidase-like deaminating enzyme
MKIAIVGGGFSGLMTALALAQSGHEVTVYEADVALGGIVRDITLAHGRFFRGCHYMNLAPDFQALWPLVDGLELTCFDHRYGSWNDLFGTVMVHHDFAQPVVPGPIGNGSSRGDDATLWQGSVADYLATHEPRVAERLNAWVSRVGDSRYLAASNVISLQVGRVFYPDDVQRVRAQKQADALKDQTLGLPRGLFEPPVGLQRCALPTAGFDGYMDSVAAALARAGVRTLTDAPVKPLRLPDGRCGQEIRGIPVEADWVVWCANPTPLLKVMAGERLDSYVTRCICVYACLQGDVPRDPVYYQTFGSKHPLMRIFSYDLGGPKLTVEALDEGWTLEELVAATHRVMHDLGWHARVTEAAAIQEKRHSLVSLHDQDCLERFAAHAADSGIITGGWHHYGRDRRLRDILTQLQLEGLI